MIGTPPPNRDRFLCAIAERIAPERVQAVFLFPPIRQGPVETCVAVLAVERTAAAIVESAEALGESAESDNAESDNAESETAEGETAESETAESETAESETAEGEIAILAHDGPSSPAARPMVLTAQYRHTLKGPDRGKWELVILEQADAPLITIETVVRGVQARLDDQVEPERLGADELRTALVEGVWTTPAR